MDFFMRIGLMILIAIILTSIEAYSQRTYPEWFIYPDQYTNYYLGYSYNGTPAVIDAEITYCVYHECIVDGELQIYDIESETDLLKSSNYYYNFSPDSLAKIENRLKLLDGKMVTVFPAEYIELFALDSIPDDFQSKTIDVYTMQKPDWIDKDFWQDNTYYYGVGEFTSIGNHNDAWKTAEERSIFKILSNLSMEVHKINIDTQSETTENMEIIRIFKVNYLLKNIQIIRRYADHENKLFMALTRIPIKGVISPMLR
jgi:hypothetical protein